MICTQRHRELAPPEGHLPGHRWVGDDRRVNPPVLDRTGGFSPAVMDLAGRLSNLGLQAFASLSRLARSEKSCKSAEGIRSSARDRWQGKARSPMRVFSLSSRMALSRFGGKAPPVMSSAPG